jgi:hypothetical protein
VVCLTFSQIHISRVYSGVGSLLSTVFADGTGTSLNAAKGLALDQSLNLLYVADFGNNRIRRIDLFSGNVTTLAGSGNCSLVDGIGTDSAFCSPFGIALDPSRLFLYVADSLNHCIRRIHVASGSVVTIAGNGSAMFADGIGTAAAFNTVRGLVMDASGSRLFMCDSNTYRVRQLMISTGQVSTLAGSGSAGFIDAVGTAASFNLPRFISIDPTGTYLLITDNNSRLRKLVISSGEVTTLTTSGLFAINPLDMLLSSPLSTLIDPTGQYVYFVIASGFVEFTLGSGAVRRLGMTASNSSTSYAFAGLATSIADSSFSTFYVVSSSPNAVFSISMNFQCSSGSYCPSGTSSPVQCPAGSFCPAGSSSPIICNIGISGTYCGVGSAEQQKCSFGYYCPNIITQSPCPAGQYCASAGLTTPSGNCSAGFYCAAGSRNAYGAIPSAASTFYFYG